jgi:hypothetical protein
VSLLRGQRAQLEEAIQLGMHGHDLARVTAAEIVIKFEIFSKFLLNPKTISLARRSAEISVVSINNVFFVFTAATPPGPNTPGRPPPDCRAAAAH